MDLHSDIKWIQNELNRVKDPELIELFKRLLLFRSKVDSVSLEDYNRELKEAEKRIEQGHFVLQTQLESLLKDE